MADAPISLQQAIERARLASDVPYVVLLDIEVRQSAEAETQEVIRITSNDENITFEGNEYHRYPFEIDLVEESKAMPEITLTVKDVTGLLTAKVNAYRGGVGFGVRVIGMNAQTLDEPEVDSRFVTLSATQSDFTLTFRLGSGNTLTTALPPRIQHKSICPWVYKGPECKYAGPLEKCDRTYAGANGCQAHENEYRFGGFPTFQ